MLENTINFRKIIKLILVITTLCNIVTMPHPYVNADYNDDELYESEEFGMDINDEILEETPEIYEEAEQAPDDEDAYNSNAEVYLQIEDNNSELSASAGGNNLSLRVGGVEGFGTAIVDVNDLPIPNNITWPLSTQRRTLEIHAEFANVGADQERRIVVEIPEGYTILEYTARSGTAVGGGVTELFLSPEDDSKIESSVLTDLNGNPWHGTPIQNFQGIDGHTGQRSSDIAFHRTRHGRIEYTFNSNMDNILLTLILGTNHTTMSRGSTSLLLNPITVTMVNGDETLDSRLYSTITELFQPDLRNSAIQYGGGPRNVSFNPSTGGTEVFRTSYHTWVHSGAMGSQPHLAGNVTFTVSYPAGVTFVGFREMITNQQYPTSTNFINNHLIVEDDPINRQVTFTYSNVRFAHHSSQIPTFMLYWEALVDGANLQPNQARPFVGSLSAVYQDGSNFTNNATVNITFVEAFYNIRLFPLNGIRHNLNQRGDFPYSHMIGGFRIDNRGSEATPDLFYRMTFPDELFIQAIRTPSRPPGVTISTDVTAIAVCSITGVVRIIEEEGPFIGIITASDLELAPDEFLREITADLSPLIVADNTIGNVHSYGFIYYGRFQNNQTGPVELTIYERGTERVIISDVDQTIIGSPNIGAGSVTTDVRHADGGRRAFSPNDRMYFTSTYQASNSITTSGVWISQNDMVDPRIIISLPEGINLDLASVSVLSTAGNNENASFTPTLASVQTQVIGGVIWTTHIFEAPNHQDMIARAINEGTVSNQRQINVTFTANVTASTQAFPELRAQDLVLWDIGQNAINPGSGTNNTLPDTHNRSGNGVDYVLAAGTTSPEIQVVLAPGFNVNLGIRETGSDVPFFTYDGTEASIASIAVGGDVEIYLSFLNNDATSLFPGTEIYLPIPRAGVTYDRFFNNIELSNPAGVITNEPTLWTGILTEEISLPGFTTTYRVVTSNVNPIPGGGITNSWVPVEGPWMTHAELIDSGHTLADVSMVRFIAYETIGAFATGSTTFEMGIGDDANIGDTNFWRTYQKGWRNATGAGSWTHGAVIAAEPAGGGISGMLFTDLNRNGIMDSGEAFRNRVDLGDDSAPIVTALLVGDNGTIINLRMNADGSFSALNDDDTINLLRVGNYTVTLTNHDPTNWHFTPTTPATRSSTTTWHMDVAQANIATNHQTATFTISIATGDAAALQLLGVGLIPRVTVTLDTNGGAFPAEEGETPDTIRTEDVFIGELIPIPETPVRDGYTFMGWYQNVEDLDTRWDFATDLVAGAITLYARWEEVEPTTEPTEPSSEPTEPTSEPTEPTSEPTEPTTEPSSEPIEPTSEPTEPTSEPTEPTSEPTEPTTGSTEPTTEPTEPTSEPTEPTTEPTSEPTEPTSESTEPTSEPTEPTSESSEATTIPTEATTIPTEATTIPTEATTAPTETTTAPTEVTTAPTETETASTESTTIPTEPSETSYPTDSTSTTAPHSPSPSVAPVRPITPSEPNTQTRPTLPQTGAVVFFSALGGSALLISGLAIAAKKRTK